MEITTENLSKQWGWMALRGLAGIVFGIMTFVWPIATIWALALLWGAFALVDGIFALGAVWGLHKKGAKWWPYLLFGIIGLVAGLMAMAWPDITALFLLYVIAFWALFGGISQLIAAVRLHKSASEDWSLGIAGALGVIFGLLLLFSPLEGALAVIMVIGFYALATGVLTLVAAVKLRAMG